MHISESSGAPRPHSHATCARRISIPHCPQLHACRRPRLRLPNHCSGNAQHEIAAVTQPGAGSSTPPTKTAFAHPAGLRPAIDPLRASPQRMHRARASAALSWPRDGVGRSRWRARCSGARAPAIPQCDPSPVVGRYTERSRRSSEVLMPSAVRPARRTDRRRRRPAASPTGLQLHAACSARCRDRRAVCIPPHAHRRTY